MSQYTDVEQQRIDGYTRINTRSKQEKQQDQLRAAYTVIIPSDVPVTEPLACPRRALGSFQVAGLYHARFPEPQAPGATEVSSRPAIPFYVQQAEITEDGRCKFGGRTPETHKVLKNVAEKFTLEGRNFSLKLSSTLTDHAIRLADAIAENVDNNLPTDYCPPLPRLLVGFRHNYPTYEQFDRRGLKDWCLHLLRKNHFGPTSFVPAVRQQLLSQHFDPAGILNDIPDVMVKKGDVIGHVPDIPEELEYVVGQMAPTVPVLAEASGRITAIEAVGELGPQGEVGRMVITYTQLPGDDVLIPACSDYENWDHMLEITRTSRESQDKALREAARGSSQSFGIDNFALTGARDSRGRPEYFGNFYSWVDAALIPRDQIASADARVCDLSQLLNADGTMGIHVWSLPNRDPHVLKVPSDFDSSPPLILDFASCTPNREQYRWPGKAAGMLKKRHVRNSSSSDVGDDEFRVMCHELHGLFQGQARVVEDKQP
jgi:hypothetical protein